MLLSLLPLVAISFGSPAGPTAAAQAAAGGPSLDGFGVITSSDRVAQVRLADMLATADSISAVRARGNTFTFSIERADEQLDVIATTHHGDIIQVVERPRGVGEPDVGSLSWLIETMKETVAVTRLEVDEDGAVMLTTADGLRLIAIPGRGSGGNAAVDARWAAAWEQA